MNHQSRFDTGYRMLGAGCSGMTQRDDMGREMGGGFRVGKSCTPVVVHVNVWQNKYSIVK